MALATTAENDVPSLDRRAFEPAGPRPHSRPDRRAALLLCTGTIGGGDPGRHARPRTLKPSLPRGSCRRRRLGQPDQRYHNPHHENDRTEIDWPEMVNPVVVEVSHVMQRQCHD